MTTSQDLNACTRRSWIAAAVIGVVVLLIMMLAAGWGFWGALVLGLVVFAICGIVFPRLFCPAQAAESQSFAPASAPAAAPKPTPVSEPAPETSAAPEPEPEGEASPEPEPKTAAAPEPKGETAPATAPAVSSVVKTGTLLPGDTEVESRKGTWRYEGGASEAAAAKPVPAAPAAATPAAPAASDSEGTVPARLDGPRDGKADNLKAIKGVGPKLESALHDIGIYHFDQIAGWSADEVAWADQNLVGFKGRVSRDNWVDQARTLAEGGETEFSKRVGKGEVY